MKEAGEVVQAMNQAPRVDADYCGSLRGESGLTRGLDEGLRRRE